MAYSEKVVEHYENPKNVGVLDKNDPTVGTGLVGAPACGDVLRLQIKVSPAGIIEDAKFKTYGCLIGKSKINTPNGYIEIKKLKESDPVNAWDGKYLMEQRIESVIKKTVSIDELLLIKFVRPLEQEGFLDASFSLVTTKNHIFWTSNQKPIEADDLSVGDELFNITSIALALDLNNAKNIKNESIKVVSIDSVNSDMFDEDEKFDDFVAVYDLELQAGAHVFFAHDVGMHNCGSAIASSSLVSEWIKGKTLEEAGQIKNQEIAEELALPPVKIHCSILAEDSIKAAIEDYRKKQKDLI